MIRSPKQTLSQSSTLSRLYHKARYQQQILRKLHQCLPFPKSAIQSCYLDQTRFVIYCSSGAWANKLRYRSQMILETLRHEAPDLLPKELESIKVLRLPE